MWESSRKKVWVTLWDPAKHRFITGRRSRGGNNAPKSTKNRRYLHYWYHYSYVGYWFDKLIPLCEFCSHAHTGADARDAFPTNLLARGRTKRCKSRRSSLLLQIEEGLRCSIAINWSSLLDPTLGSYFSHEMIMLANVPVHKTAKELGGTRASFHTKCTGLTPP